MSLSPQFLDQLRSRLSLSDIIGRRIKVTRAGREYKACCPFHKEKTPSFTINDEKQFYHCFGCGAHGDVIKFVMEHDNLSFMDAVEQLAALAGMDVPKPTPAQAQQAKKEKGLHELLEETALWYQEQLYNPRHEEALRYLQDRGLQPETIKKFRIGYADNDSAPLLTHLKDKGFEVKQMIEAGVMRPSKKQGGEPYAFFRDRVIFPVSDGRGRVVAFGGRILPEHLRPPTQSDFKPPKYINSSDTPVFNKGWILYGENFARKASAEGQTALVVEGYLDVIACHQAGLEGAIASMGTALTEHQISNIWNMAKASEKTPVLCFDGDNAGYRAAERACERILPLLKPDQSVRFAFLPEGEDPDTMIKTYGVKTLKDYLIKSQSLFDFLWQIHTAGRSFETPEEKAGLTKNLQTQISKIADADVQLYYKQQMKEKISDTFFARKNYNNRGYNKGSYPLTKPGQSGGVGLKLKRPASKQAFMVPKILIAALINHPYIYDGIEDELSSFEINDPRLNSLREKIIAYLSYEPEMEANQLKENLKNEGFTKEIRDILNESVYVHASFCSPSSDSHHVEERWRSFYQDMQNALMNKEIRFGWRDALQSASIESEEKVRNLLQMRIKQKNTGEE